MPIMVDLLFSFFFIRVSFMGCRVWSWWSRLQPALFHQALDAVVGLAQADAHLRGQFALAMVGLLFYEFEEFTGEIF